MYNVCRRKMEKKNENWDNDRSEVGKNKLESRSLKRNLEVQNTPEGRSL